MIILWKRFVAWVIESRNDPFTKARLKLTAIYLVIIVGIIVFYLFLLDREYIRITHIFANAEIPDISRRARFVSRATIVSKDTLFSIQYEDVFMFLLTIGISYLLAGLALKPLKKIIMNQKQFLTDISHELRTPLSVIRLELETFLQSAQKDPNGKILPRKREDIESNLDELDRMGKLLNNLLLIARLDNYQEKFQFAPVNLRSAVARTVKLMKSTMPRNKHRFNMDIPENIIVLADSHKMHQVWINILENAIKYSKDNGEINIRATRGSKTVSILFSDNGRGIDAKELPFLFDRFYRSKKEQSSNMVGSGLGLAISQIIIKRHGGIISIESIPNIGTTVTISLPLADY